MTTNAYSFLSWLRSGISTRVTDDPGAAARARVPVRLRVSGDPLSGGPLAADIERSVQLYGPGDVIGVDPRAVSRTEPRPGTTNAEPNYLAHIEFYDEDFVWRYSPAPPDDATKRLAPWLALVVLAAGADPAHGGAEFTESGQPESGGVLPSITVRDPQATLPPPDQLGAWAHVHVNGSLHGPVASDSTAGALDALGDVLRANADHACSRLLCPRRLRANTAYEAFLVPAFETGRLAGLGLDPSLSPGALYSGWGPPYAGRPAAGRLPYYHRWSFTSGSTGDFESLVRLLRPRTPDPLVGRRDIDVHRSPGLGLPGIVTPDRLGGVLRLGGALKVPDPPGGPVDEAENWDNWHDAPPPAAPYPHPFEKALAALINLADDYQRHTPATAHARAAEEPLAPGLADEADPVLTPTLYGRWHALTSRLLTDEDGTPLPSPANRNWVHRLNLDPRFRVAAHFGTQVVQARQEELMAAAWAQVGEVLAANSRIRAAQLAREVGHVLQTKHLNAPPTAARSAVTAAASSGRSLRLTAPAHSRVTAAAVPDLAAGRRGEPGDGALAEDVTEKVAVGFRVAASQVAAAPLSAAMRRITRPTARLMRSLPFTADRPADALVPRMDVPSGAVAAAPPKTVPRAVVTVEQVAAALHPTGTGQDPVDSLPHSPDFVLRDLGDPVAPTPGATDSPEALLFKSALRELHQGLDAAAAVGRPVPRLRLGVADTTTSVLTGLKADTTVPKSLLGAVDLPERLRPFADQFIEAMAYPVFDLPTYQALLELSVDVFVPHIDRVPQNSITLLADNREFIEAYLVGLNHEMARELLWREYPTDQRGTPFRQFWDTRALPLLAGESAGQRHERGYDIAPVHTWPPDAVLGENSGTPTTDTQASAARLPGTRRKDNLVLVIRGELLKKYPTAAVYAQRAAWPTGLDGRPDLSQERVLVEPVDEDRPPPSLVRLPLYEAKIEPDIYLLGFDLDADEARGHAPDDAGWFFVLKERPGDPRFGVDDGPQTRVEVWNDLSWTDVDPRRHGFIELDPGVSVPLVGFDGSEDDPEKRDQRTEDENLPLWHAGLSSADVAYILFQVPVLVAVHAQEMLPR
ncbi:hypothetical protein [Streptomyces spectabilis]|uniref:Uncharacterized protein n=1 Tax=Streptomyces spectabilis TaxID=68270 RepID=A0A516R1R6_STRST|nr:hypothetical protein [Streptomyces spectabilis]QDQ09592.1 hypothetical protein FH965_02645 [Streptomyces spectabilis]